MQEFDEIGQEYVRLALQIDQHQEGFVDGYFGPEELKAQVKEAGSKPIEQLQDELITLNQAISQADIDDTRRDFLEKQLRGMQTVLKRVAGEPLDLVDEVAGCFDFTPERIPTSEFETAYNLLESTLPGKGNLAERQATWQKQFVVPQARILPALQMALAETHRRSTALFNIPSPESVEIELVKNQPWSGYNWYLGQAKSRIDINTDLPVRANNMLNLIAHEAYPGHHSEHVCKETRWYTQEKRLEHSILLLLTPESTLAEAIATTAQDIIFPDETDLVDWTQNTLYPAAGIKASAEQAIAVAKAKEKLGGVSGNAAFMLHQDGRPEAEVLDYIQTYGLRSEKEARQSLGFISHPTFRAYVFNYFYGAKLLKDAFKEGDRVEIFHYALTEPVTPSALKKLT